MSSQVFGWDSPLKGRSLLTLIDYRAQEVRYLLDLAHAIKAHDAKHGATGELFKGKSIALVFEKRSTRTRSAFETAFGEEGGHPVFLSPADIHLGVKESIEDTARVLGRMYSAIQFRGFQQETVLRLAACSGVPVYNGLTDAFHPTQALADLMTIEEAFGTLKGVQVVYVGDARNNVARSLGIACALMGAHCRFVAPQSLHLDAGTLAHCERLGKDSGSRIERVSDPVAGMQDAQAVYTDVWVSMGEEAQSAERIALLSPYQVNEESLKLSGRDDTIFLHCLPAVRGKEVTDGVMDGPASRVFDQAENRKHTLKALIAATI